MSLVRNVMFAAAALSFVTTSVGCGGGGQSKGGSAAEDKSPIDELKGIPAELDAEVAKLLGPIDNVNALLEQFGALPTKLGISGLDLTGQVKAIMDGAPAPSINGLQDSAKVELDTFLGQVKAFKEGITAVPENVTSLTAKCVELTAKVPVLATKVTASATATGVNPFASAEDKAKAKADAEAVAGLQAEISGKISETQGKITGIPAKATEALAKFTAALVGG